VGAAGRPHQGERSSIEEILASVARIGVAHRAQAEKTMTKIYFARLEAAHAFASMAETMAENQTDLDERFEADHVPCQHDLR
jgi:hypothetical protein